MNNTTQIPTAMRPFLRGLPLILTLTLLSITAARIYLHYSSPMYESVSYIKLADPGKNSQHSSVSRDLDIFSSYSVIGAEVEMLKSKSVIYRAMKNLDLGITVTRLGELHNTELYKESPFRITAMANDPKGYDSTYKMTVASDSLVTIVSPDQVVYTGKLNQPINMPFLDLLIQKNDSLLQAKPFVPINDRYEVMVNAPATLSDYIRDQIDVMNTDKDVPVLRVAFKSKVPQKSADIVNEISDAYIQDYVEEKYLAADKTVNFLDKELSSYGLKLDSSEKSVEDYKQINGVVNVKEESETDIRSLGDLRVKLAGMQMDMVAIDSLARYIRNGMADFNNLAPNFQTFNDLLSTEMIKKVKELQEQKKDLLLKYTPANEQVKIIDVKLTDLYVYMGQSVQNTRTDLQLKYNDLQRTVRAAEATMQRYPEKDRNMTLLGRNFDLNDQIYRFLREKRTDAEIARAADISFHRIITKGEVPVKPVSPIPMLVLALAAILGFIFATVIAYAYDFFRGRVTSAASVEKQSDIPVLATIPFLKTATGSRRAFEKLAAELQVKKSLEKGAFITITSFDKGEGKRTAALGLAAAIASLGKTCAIIDADGSLDKYAASFPDIHTAANWGQDWFQPKVFPEILQELQYKYEVIICKTAPLTRDSTSLLMLSPATMSFFMLDGHITKLTRVEDVNLLQQELGLTNLHFLLNRTGYHPGFFPALNRRISSLIFPGRPKPSII
jgi:uncharacterized protein involved in exopolysaccharide biosynthesis